MPNWKALENLPKFTPRRITPLGKPIHHLKLTGTPREIGFQRGKELTEDINGHLEWMRYYIVHVCEVPMSRWDGIASRLEKNLLVNAPWMLEEIGGMAEACGVPARDLILGNFYALLAEAEGNWCTSVAVRRSDEGPLLGQNLDIGPDDFHYVEEWRPTGGHAVLRHMSVMMCRHECGINDAGLAVASSNLPATAQSRTPWDWNGTYFHFLPTLVLRNCGSVAEAIDYLRSLSPIIPSAAGYQLNLIDPTGAMAVVDRTGHHAIVRQCEPDLNFTSNCTLDDEFDLWRLGDDSYTDGRARVKRIREEWRKLQGTTPTRAWLEGLMRTDQGEGYLCRWSEMGYSRLGFIFSPTRKTMDISNGPPNRTRYERFEFTG